MGFSLIFTYRVGRPAITLFTVAGLAGIAHAQATDPQLTSWFTENSGRYARVVETRGGKPVTTWPAAGLPTHGTMQSAPAYADIQQVSYSTDFVYVKGTGLASHQMGPWYISLDRIFDNWPTNQNYIHRFPRHPKPAAVRTTNGGGALGLWVNGVALFNLLDMNGYDTQTGRDTQAGPSSDAFLWMRNAVVVEQPTFDASNAHQPPMGTYHYHDNPVALRYQLKDNVAYNAAANRYREDTSRLHHSPILGWSDDGYPIYGPYGFSDPKSAKSGVRRIVAGYALRDGSRHTEDLRKTGRHTLAQWAATLHSVPAVLSTDQYGPDVSRRYTLGRYVEDYDFLGDEGYVQGRDFDLDICNGRFCVTPEFPKGTYAYFVTIEADGSPAFPYVIGRQWYGEPVGGEGNRIVEKVTVFRDLSPTAPTKVARMGKNGESLSWRSVEGAHYTVSVSRNGKDWSTLAASIASEGTQTSYTLSPAERPIADEKFKVMLASLDPYDNTGSRQMGRGGGGPGGDGPRGGGPQNQGGGRGEMPGGSISQISPAMARRGETVTLRISLGQDPPPPPDFIQPLSVKVGNFAAQKASWNGETVTAIFAIPAGAVAGTSDVTVTFPAPPDRGGNLTFTGKQEFTIR